MGLCSDDKYNIHCARTCGFCKKELQNVVIELEERKFWYRLKILTCTKFNPG